jgi:hypothetical protein
MVRRSSAVMPEQVAWRRASSQRPDQGSGGAGGCNPPAISADSIALDRGHGRDAGRFHGSSWPSRSPTTPDHGHSPPTAPSTRHCNGGRYPPDAETRRRPAATHLSRTPCGPDLQDRGMSPPACWPSGSPEGPWCPAGRDARRSRASVRHQATAQLSRRSHSPLTACPGPRRAGHDRWQGGTDPRLVGYGLDVTAVCPARLASPATWGVRHGNRAGAEPRSAG